MFDPPSDDPVRDEARHMARAEGEEWDGEGVSVTIRFDVQHDDLHAYLSALDMPTSIADADQACDVARVLMADRMLSMRLRPDWEIEKIEVY